MRDLPESSFDPYDAQNLDDPFAHFDELRRAGPWVHLSVLKVAASARFDVVQNALNAPAEFRSGAGVGYTNLERGPYWRSRSILVEADPPDHQRMKALAWRCLPPGLQRGVFDGALAMAREIVATVSDGQVFEAIDGLARAVPTRLFCDVMGLPEHGREHLAVYGDLNFNSFGPENARFTGALEHAAMAREWVASSCRRATLAPAGAGAAVFTAVDGGEISEEQGELMVRALLAAGLDTTVAATGNALFCFARWPETWFEMDGSRAAWRRAVEEVLRLETPAQFFYRAPQDPAGFGLPVDGPGKVLLMLGAANRDPARWDEPAAFRPARDYLPNLAFGAGPHACLGQELARVQCAAVLEAIWEARLRPCLAGDVMRKINNTSRSLARLPIVLKPM